MSRIIPSLSAENGGSISVLSTGNSTTTPLNANITWTGQWESVLPYASISILAVADVDATLYVEFSVDGSSINRTVQLSRGDTSDMGIHSLIPVAKYFRVKVVNGTTDQSSLAVQTLYDDSPRVAQPTSRASQVVSDYSDVLNVRILTDPKLDEVSGRQANRSVFIKQGYNSSIVSGTREDIWTVGGLYTGWLTAASAVRIRAGGNANDTAAGTGARKVKVIGLDQDWNYTEEEISTNGASASAATTTTFIRAYCFVVTESGTYTGTNIGNINIETTAGTLVGQIGLDITGAGLGRCQMMIYTVPAGKHAYIRRISVSSSSNKPADVFFYAREDADIVTAPFSAPAVWHASLNLEGEDGHVFETYPSFPEKTDLWAAAVASANGTAITAEFDLVLVDNGV